MKHSSRGSKKGFTLIELLVVISIIGLLSSVVLASLNTARGKARDVVRVAELNQIYTALEAYYIDNGYLPTTSSYGGADPGGWDYSSQGAFLPFLTSSYMPKVPVDPTNNGTGDVYYGGSGYSFAYYCYTGENSLALGARLESGTVVWKSNHEPGFICQ